MIAKTKVPDKKIEVLLVEDNPGDVRLFLEEFKYVEISSNIHVVSNGLNAMKFLHREGEYLNMPRPDLLVLDIYLPLKSGFEILTEIGNDKELNEIPVVVFSSSEIVKDHVENIQNIPNIIFLNKPDELEDYDDIINRVREFLLK